MEEDQDDFDEFDEEEVKIDPATLAPDLFEACKNKETGASVCVLGEKSLPVAKLEASVLLLLRLRAQTRRARCWTRTCRRFTPSRGASGRACTGPLGTGWRRACARTVSRDGYLSLSLSLSPSLSTKKSRRREHTHTPRVRERARVCEVEKRLVANSRRRECFCVKVRARVKFPYLGHTHTQVEIVERLLAVKAAQPYAHARARASRTSRSTRQQQGEEDGAAEEGGVEKGGHTSEAVEARYLGISSQVLMRNTPLHWAAFHGHLRVAWLLLEAGYASDDCDEVGNTPLHLAAAGGHAPVVRALLADGCDVQACNHFSNAASAVATDERVRELLRNQAARQLRPPTLAERCASRAGNLRRYRAIATELQQATEGQGAHDVKSLLEQAARLREALAVSREECVAHPLVATGERALLRVVTHIALREQVDAVRREAPIVSQTKYTAAVNKLKRLRFTHSSTLAYGTLYIWNTLEA